MVKRELRDSRLLPNDNELYVELMGLATNLLPWVGNASPSRMVMLGSQISQSLVTKALTRNRYFVGTEFEYGKYTFSVKSGHRYEVVSIIPKYQTSSSRNGIKQNPSTYYIVRNIRTSELDVIELPIYCSHHNNFGWEYVINKPLINKLTVGATIQEGDILADSPGMSPEGCYRFSCLTNVLAMSSHWCTEDGFMASREWLNENVANGWLDLDIIPPKGYYFLNIYGDKYHYKPLPGPGDRIREDGLVAALRKHDDILGAVDLTLEGLTEIDWYFDKLYFVEAGAHNARVVDIDIFNNLEGQPTIDPVPTEDDDAFSNQLTTLWERNLQCRTSIIKSYKEECIRRNKEPMTSKRMSGLLRECYMTLLPPYDVKRPEQVRRQPPRLVEYSYRSSKIHSYHVKVKIMYDVIPSYGYKFTGLYGNKGVICKIKPRAEMPTDRWGHVADLVFDAQPPINRMIPATPFEIGWNAHCRDQEDRMREYVEEHGRNWDVLWDMYLEFIRIAAPVHYDFVKDYTGDDILDELEPIIDGNMMFLNLPPNTPDIGVEMMAQLDENFDLRKDVLTFVGDSGDMLETVDPMLVGQMGVMMLEKTGHDFSAIDFPKRQAHGVPAKLTSLDKHSLPYRSQVIRVYGEAEVRAYLALIGANYVADQIDRANNPRAQEVIAYKLISSDKPSSLTDVIDRNEIKVGTGLHRSYMDNALYVAGAAFTYSDTDRIMYVLENQVGEIVDGNLSRI